MSMFVAGSQGQICEIDFHLTFRNLTYYGVDIYYDALKSRYEVSEQ